MDDPHWYKNAIIYAIDIEKFHDGNGDGIGDLPGAMQKLDYLASLGVTCVWLLPFYPSPRRDNGYDITDYFGVDSRFGTIDDLIAFIRRAGEFGMQVILDLVVNHTSDEHPWFRAARLDESSGYRDFYVWSDAPPPPPPGTKTIFPGEEDGVWTFDEVAQNYYFHRFYHFQPELNLANERVRKEIRDIVDYWLSFGIAGMRLDAAAPMIHEKGQDDTIPADPHQTLREIYSFLQQRRRGAVLLGEVDVPPEKLRSFFEEEIQMNLFFNFYLNNHFFLGMATERADPIERALRILPSLPAECGWANFLRNLDELDLEQLTDEERETTMSVFAPKPEMRIFGRGIRRRLAPMMNGDRRRVLLAFSLLFSLPGAPVVVYGDEIGMGEDLSRPGREAVRTPMQWSGGRNAGFSTANPNKLVAPVIGDGPFSYKRLNVEAEEADEESLITHIRNLCTARRTHSVIAEGGQQLIKTEEPAVLAHSYNLGYCHLVALHNLSGKPCKVTLGSIGTGAGELTPIIGAHCIKFHEGHQFELTPYGYAWLTTEGL